MLTIAATLALLSAAALCIYLIVVLARVRVILLQMEKDFKELSARALPILENTEYITSRLKSIADTIDEQVLSVRDSIASVRQIADNVVELERRIQEQIEGPFLESLSFAAAIFKGVRTFVERFRS